MSSNRMKKNKNKNDEYNKKRACLHSHSVLELEFFDLCNLQELSIEFCVSTAWLRGICGSFEKYLQVSDKVSAFTLTFSICRVGGSGPQHRKVRRSQECESDERKL